MKANELLDMIGNADDFIIEEAKKVKKAPPRWIRWAAVAACLCILAFGAVKVLLRFDYFKAGCGAMPGTIVGSDYYYYVQNSGVWRYSGGSTEKVLSAFWEDGWLINESGLYYANGKNLYRMELQTLEKVKIYSASDGTHIAFDLENDGNIIVTVYDKNEKYAYQTLIEGETGEELEQLTGKVPYGNLEQLYTNLHYHVGKREIVLVPIDGSSKSEKYMPIENGNALLPDGYWVGSYCYIVCDGLLCFDVYNDSKITEESLMVFADGNTILHHCDFRYSGAIGHVLLYVDYEDPENYGSNGSGIWCFDCDSGESWQLGIDAECEFYEFVNDNTALYSCVPWNHAQTAWQIIYDGDRPVSLHLIDTNIAE